MGFAAAEPIQGLPRPAITQEARVLRVPRDEWPLSRNHHRGCYPARIYALLVPSTAFPLLAIWADRTQDRGRQFLVPASLHRPVSFRSQALYPSTLPKDPCRHAPERRAHRSALGSSSRREPWVFLLGSGLAIDKGRFLSDKNL